MRMRRFEHQEPSKPQKKKEKRLEMTDDLLLLLNYLELGVWLSVDLDPISSIKKALENNFDKLILEFGRK